MVCIPSGSPPVRPLVSSDAHGAEIIRMLGIYASRKATPTQRRDMFVLLAENPQTGFWDLALLFRAAPAQYRTDFMRVIVLNFSRNELGAPERAEWDALRAFAPE